MSWLTNHHNQSATYWAASGVDGSGESTWATPVAISVRWEEQSEIFIDDRGEQRLGKSVVYTDRSMSRGDYIFLGTSVAADPHDVVNSKIIQDYREIPNLGNSHSERRVIV